MGYNSELHIQLQDELISLSNKAENGDISNLDALIHMRQHREQFEKSLAIIKDFEDSKIQEIANESAQYPEGYRGFEIKMVNGRKTYKYDGIEEISVSEQATKVLKDKYQSAFENFQKGNQITEEVDGVLHWADADGFLHPFPELTFGKSYLTVKQKK